MLESNTDRSWFMIGAVVVGALIIAAVWKLFPELFAGISTKLKALIESIPVSTPE